MSKPKKPKRNEFADLLEKAATQIDHVLPALNDALEHAKTVNHAHGKMIINRLIIHAMAIAKGARQLAGLPPSAHTAPQEPASPPPAPTDLNRKAT